MDTLEEVQLDVQLAEIHVDHSSKCVLPGVHDTWVNSSAIEGQIATNLPMKRYCPVADIFAISHKILGCQ